MSGVALNVGSLARFRGRINSLSRAVKQVLPDLGREWPFALWAQTGGRIDATWDTRPLAAPETRVVSGVTQYSPHNLTARSWRLSSWNASTWVTPNPTYVGPGGLIDGKQTGRFSTGSGRSGGTTGYYRNAPVTSGVVHYATFLVRRVSGSDTINLNAETLPGTTTVTFQPSTGVISTTAYTSGPATVTARGDAWEVALPFVHNATGNINFSAYVNGVADNTMDVALSVSIGASHFVDTDGTARYLPFPGSLAPAASLPGPVNNLTRAGLAMRVGPTGLLEQGPNNLFAQSSNLAASPPTWYHGANGNSITSEWGATAVAGPVAGINGWAVQRAGGGAIVQNITLTAGERYDFVWWLRVPSGTASATITGPVSNVVAAVTSTWQRFNLAFTAASSGLTQLILNLSSATAYEISMARFHQGGVSRASDDTSLITTTAARYLPRIAYNASTLASQGLLIEGAATNILNTWSDFTTGAGWTVSSLTTAASVVAGPSGAVEGTTISAGTNTSQGVYKSFTVSASTVYTLSMRVKLGTMAANEFMFALYDNSNAGFIASDIVPTQTLTADAWVRVIYTFTTPAGCTSLRVYPFRRSAALASTKTVHVSNGQLELGSVATSDIPNPGTGTAVRAADDWFLSGDALTAALGADTSVGAMYVEFVMPAVPSGGAFPGVVSIESPTERLALWVTPIGLVSLGGYGGAAANAQIDFGTYAPGTTVKAAFRWSATGYAGTTNGLSVVTSANARNLAGATALRLGKTVISAPYLGSTIGRTMVLSPNITDAQMQALTA